MAMRCNDHAQPAEPDPAWLKDLPKPAGAPGVKSNQETIPTPPAKANEGSTSGLGDGFKLQPAANSDSVNSSIPVPKPELGEGFKLGPRAPQGERSGDDSKPAIQGLESTPDKPALSTPDGGGATLPAAQGTSPATARFEPEPSASDPPSTAQPSLLPPSSP
jgi:hypothetical protein